MRQGKIRRLLDGAGEGHARLAGAAKGVEDITEVIPSRRMPTCQSRDRAIGRFGLKPAASQEQRLGLDQPGADIGLIAGDDAGRKVDGVGEGSGFEAQAAPRPSASRIDSARPAVHARVSRPHREAGYRST